MTSRLLLLVAALAGLSLPAAAAVPCVTVQGPAPGADAARAALADRGIGTPTEGCTPAALSLTPTDDGSWSWALSFGAGQAATRTLADPRLGAAWVDSMVHDPRTAALLIPDAPGDDPELGGARLFATFEAWKAGTPSAVIDLPLVPRAVDAHLIGEGGLELMWALDRPRKEAKGEGAVFAIEHGAEVYINAESPLAFRKRAFGRLDVIGDHGLYQDEFCYWVPAQPGGLARVECNVQPAVIDLQSGEVTYMTKRELTQQLRSHPDLLEEFRAARRSSPVVQMGFARALIERQEQH